MIIPVVCYQCGAHLRLSCDTEKKKLVAVCVECESEYELGSIDLSDDMVSDIQARFALSDVGKTLSYMVKKV